MCPKVCAPAGHSARGNSSMLFCFFASFLYDFFEVPGRDVVFYFNTLLRSTVRLKRTLSTVACATCPVRAVSFLVKP